MAPSIPPSNGETVLITGINGYIASVLGLHLLSKGYSLRGTARRAATTEPLTKGPYAPYGDRVKIVEVADMTVEGAFDEAAKGVDGIFHTASPIDFSLTKYEQMVTPAVKGVEALLNSALKAGPQLKSVVLTSSTIAVVNPDKPAGYTFSEADFASTALSTAIKNEEDGTPTPSGVLYAASKTASERAVWDFRDAHKPSFAITTVNPSVVMGPPIVLPSDPSKFNETLRPVFSLFSGPSSPVPPNIGSASFVDVRDVALIHTWAYENSSKADGERYIASSGYGPLQAAADILRAHFKGTKFEEKIVVGKPGDGYVGYNATTGEVKEVDYPEKNYKITGKKAEEAVGLKFTPLTKTIVDTAKGFEPLL